MQLTPEQERIVQILVERGALEVRNGSVTLNFDSEGKLASIERKDSLYSKRHEGA